jgi:hypothetical protein
MLQPVDYMVLFDWLVFLSWRRHVRWTTIEILTRCCPFTIYYAQCRRVAFVSSGAVAAQCDRDRPLSVADRRDFLCPLPPPLSAVLVSSWLTLSVITKHWSLGGGDCRYQ